MAARKLRYNFFALGTTLVLIIVSQGNLRADQTSYYQNYSFLSAIGKDFPNSIDSNESKKKSCISGDENRSSDLCAQWKAADAAADSVYWARADFVSGFIGVITGFFTLAAAAAAALFAKKAAEHTEAGAKEARRSADAAEISIGASQAQTIAYLFFNKVSAVDKREKDDPNFELHGIMIVVEIGNAGNSPAKEVELDLGYRYYPIDEMMEESKRNWFSKKLGIISPKGEISSIFIPVFNFHQIVAIRSEEVECEISVRLRYIDVFGRRHSLSEYYYLSGPDFNVPLFSTPRAEFQMKVNRLD